MKQPSHQPPQSSYPDKTCPKTQSEAFTSTVGPSKSSGPRVIGFGGCSKSFVPKTPSGYFIKACFYIIYAIIRDKGWETWQNIIQYLFLYFLGALVSKYEQ